MTFDSMCMLNTWKAGWRNRIRERSFVFNVTYYRWEEISLYISGVGWRRLVFEATYTGEGVSSARQIAIDNVTLNEEPCKAKGICSI